MGKVFSTHDRDVMRAVAEYAQRTGTEVPFEDLRQAIVPEGEIPTLPVNNQGEFQDPSLNDAVSLYRSGDLFAEQAPKEAKARPSWAADQDDQSPKFKAGPLAAYEQRLFSGSKEQKAKYRKQFSEAERMARKAGLGGKSGKDFSLGAYMRRLELVADDDKASKRLFRELVQSCTLDVETPGSLDRIARQLFDQDVRQAIAEGRGGDIEGTTFDDHADKYRDFARSKARHQAESLETWLSYLHQNDGAYPMWFRYMALRGVLKLGVLRKDDEAWRFTKRTSKTLSAFPDLDREALAAVYTAIRERGPADMVESFDALYASALQRAFLQKQSLGDDTEGVWVKYPQGSDPTLLEAALKNRGTGWCTAEGAAPGQLEAGDFHVYFTKDDVGEFRQPRIAIRMKGRCVAEVRGIEKSQHLEDSMADIAKTRFMALPGGDSYERKADNVKRLGELHRRWSKDRNCTFSTEELVFLYEADQKYEGFGYNRDPRLGEIVAGRAPLDDLLGRIAPRVPSALLEPSTESEPVAARRSDLDAREAIWLAQQHRDGRRLDADALRLVHVFGRGATEGAEGVLAALREERAPYREQDFALAFPASESRNEHRANDYIGHCAVTKALQGGRLQRHELVRFYNATQLDPRGDEARATRDRLSDAYLLYPGLENFVEDPDAIAIKDLAEALQGFLRGDYDILKRGWVLGHTMQPSGGDIIVNLCRPLLVAALRRAIVVRTGLRSSEVAIGNEMPSDAHKIYCGFGHEPIPVFEVPGLRCFNYAPRARRPIPAGTVFADSDIRLTGPFDYPLDPSVVFEQGALFEPGSRAVTEGDFNAVGQAANNEEVHALWAKFYETKLAEAENIRSHAREALES